MRFLNAIVWAAAAAGVALMKLAGRRPGSYDYTGRHFHARKAGPASKAALAVRVASAGVQQPTAPEPDEPTVALSASGVQARWQVHMHHQSKNVTVHDAGTVEGYLCAAESGEHYECELHAGHESDHAACAGEITWSRTEMAVAS